MDECFRCGVSGDKARLFDAISREGVVKICSICSREEDIPIIGKVKENVDFSKLRDPPKKKSLIYERLSKLTGIGKIESFENVALKKQEEELKKVMESNFKKSIESTASKDNFIENFHWVIMRARRMKKMTQDQFAEKIMEPLIAVKNLEKGIVPREYEKLIQKVEHYLGINILKNKPQLNDLNMDNNFEFDELATKSITIEDLKEAKEKKQKGFFQRFWNSEDTEKKRDPFDIDESGVDLVGDLFWERKE